MATFDYHLTLVTATRADRLRCVATLKTHLPHITDRGQLYWSRRTIHLEQGIIAPNSAAAHEYATDISDRILGTLQATGTPVIGRSTITKSRGNLTADTMITT